MGGNCENVLQKGLRQVGGCEKIVFVVRNLLPLLMRLELWL
jgi:hypothetical protein